MLLFPLAGFVVLLAFGRRMGDPVAGWVGTAAVTGAFVSACVVLAGLIDLPSSQRLITDNYWTWFSSGGLSVPVGTLVDPLSMTMCMFVTGVSALIHLYSVAYMKRDRDFTKFFVYLNLFVFSMVLLVLADNLVLTFVGWEGVGVCSYFLVAFWFEREAAASAGKKAFIYNRIGDAGFLLAIFLLFEKTGTVQYESGPGRRHLRPAVPPEQRDGDGRRAPAVPGRRRQVGPDPPVQLAARRHGRPDAGLRAHPRRHHGHRGRLPALSHEPAAPPDLFGDDGHRGHRHRHGLRGRHHRLRPAGHQEGAGLLDRLADRLHDAGRRLGGLRRGDLPDGHARLLQGAPVPRGRLGHPRARGRAGPQAHGGDPPLHALDDRHLHRGLAGHHRHPAPLGLLRQGRRPRQRLLRTTRGCGSSRW